MLAGVLVVLVFVDSFLTGWLLRSQRELQGVVTKLGEIQQEHDFVIQHFMDGKDA